MPADLSVLGFDGAHLSSIGMFLDAFGLVRDQVAALFGHRTGVGMATQCQLVAPGGLPIKVAGAIELRPGSGLPAATQQLVHVPHVPRAPFADEPAFRGADEIARWIAAQHAGGAIVSGSGGAIFLLAQAGILGRRVVPLSGNLAAAFAARFPHIPIDRRSSLVDHGDLVLARGPASEQGLLVHLVTRLMSPTVAGALAQCWGMEGESEEGLSNDPLIAAAQVWLGERYTTNPRIADLADHLAVGQHTLLRRFRAKLGLTPRDYLQTLRIHAAQAQLRRTNRPIAQIAVMVGYDDQRSFREAFRARTGVSPRVYRQQNAEEPENSSLVEIPTAAC